MYSNSIFVIEIDKEMICYRSKDNKKPLNIDVQRVYGCGSRI
jgi:hypothetical protein